MGTLVQPSTHIKRKLSNTNVAHVQRRSSASWIGASFVKRRSAGAWVWLYSTPDVNAGGGGAATDSGASTNGTTSVGLTATPGGNRSGSDSFAWSYVSGDAGISLDNINAQNPNAARDFTGVSNGTTSAGVTAVWEVTLTDLQSGAQVTSQVTVGPLAWQNTIPSFSPFTQTFTGGQSGSVPVPNGATRLTLTMVAGGGWEGGSHFVVSTGDYWGGGGGGSGGYNVWSVPISAGDWGASINYAVGQAGQNVNGSNATNSTVSGWITESVTAGGRGGDASGAGVPGTGGVAGAPNGNPGGAGSDNRGGDPGASPYAGYGQGNTGMADTFTSDGTDGVILFDWS